jgi:hypothetical protein
MGFVGPDHLGISFTCGVCDTRITKSVKRKSYETGVVLIKCPGCEKHHVIADNLGYYQGVTKGMKNIEELAAEKGEAVTRGNARRSAICQCFASWCLKVLDSVLTLSFFCLKSRPLCLNWRN